MCSLEQSKSTFYCVYDLFLWKKNPVSINRSLCINSIKTAYPAITFKDLTGAFSLNFTLIFYCLFVNRSLFVPKSQWPPCPSLHLYLISVWTLILSTVKTKLKRQIEIGILAYCVIQGALHFDKLI